MKFGIHLPQFGRASGPESVTEAAQHAEALGYDDIWVSDHLALPARIPYPPTAYIHEPFVTLTWAAAATKRVGLGFSVLVVPMRHPIELAKMFASLDIMSGGRVTVGAGVGWLEAEFDAVGVPFRERGKRTDDTIRIMRACWTEDPVTLDGGSVPAKLREIRTLPRPARPVPIWIGGQSDAAIERAIRSGDGYHGSRSDPETIAPLVARLRAARPEETFTISTRLSWDGLEDDHDDMQRQIAGFRELGVQHLMFQPRQRYAEDWHRSVETLWNLASRA